MTALDILDMRYSRSLRKDTPAIPVGKSHVRDEEPCMTRDSVGSVCPVSASYLPCAKTASLFIGGAAVIDSEWLKQYATASVCA
jgi:hypothetical protein